MRAGEFLKIDAADLARAADADGAGRRLAGVGLEPLDQFLHVVRRQRLPADQHQRRRRQQRHGSEIVLHVELHRINRRRADKTRPVAEDHGVAVGLGAREAGHGDAAAGAADILDDQRLAEPNAHRLGQSRASVSTGPPAGNGTMMVIGRVG